MSRVGILSGTFDPVHAGHIAFALKAIEQGQLDEVYLAPEQLPRRKEGVTHYAHRVAMLRLALKPHKKLKLLELPDKQFSVSKTLPRLKKRFAKDDLYLLIGSDMVDLLISPKASEQWPGLSQMLKEISFIVSVREKRIREDHRQKIDRLQPQAVAFGSDKPYASSRDIREALLRGKQHKDVLPSIKAYIKGNWLYTSLAAVPLAPENNS